MAEASNPQLIEVRSHTVSLQYASGSEVTREECYPRLTAEWRGEMVLVDMSADRYVASSGWTDWRVTPRSFKPDASEIAARKLADVCRPLVEEWLNSDAYRRSRQAAFKWMIRSQVREERINADNPARTLATHRHELTASDALALTAAIDHLRAMLYALSS